MEFEYNEKLQEMLKNCEYKAFMSSIQSDIIEYLISYVSNKLSNEEIDSLNDVMLYIRKNDMEFVKTLQLLYDEEFWTQYMEENCNIALMFFNIIKKRCGM